MPKLSVVMPAYNEGENITAAMEDVVRDVFSVVADAELIVVDDGSSDDTFQLVQAFSKNEPRVTVLRQENAGHGPALRRGMDASVGDVMLLLDSDRQIGLEQFGDHWQQLDGLLMGIRRPRNDPASRLVITLAMRLLIRALFGKAPTDAGVPYKLIRRDLWDFVSPMINPGSWIPSVMLAISVQNSHPERYFETPVRHLARRGGESSLKLGRLARFCLNAARDLWSLRRQSVTDIHRAGSVERRQD